MRRNDDRKGDPRWRRPTWAVAAALAAMLAGCGDDNKAPDVGTYYPVAGKITLPDGKPLTSTNVVFIGPVTGTTKTDSDGTFSFKGAKDGLPAGDYKIRLEVVEAKGTAKHPVVPFPAKYLDEDTSDLTATVKSDSNNLDLKLNQANATVGKPAGDQGKGR